MDATQTVKLNCWLSEPQENYAMKRQIYHGPPDIKPTPSIAESTLPAYQSLDLTFNHSYHGLISTYLQPLREMECNPFFASAPIDPAWELPSPNLLSAEISLQSPTPKSKSTSPIPSGATTEPETSNSRRAQNRRAQRAFRERKEQMIRSLEEQVTAATEMYDKLEQQHVALQTAYARLMHTVEILVKEEGCKDVLWTVVDVLLKNGQMRT